MSREIIIEVISGLVLLIILGFWKYFVRLTISLLQGMKIKILWFVNKIKYNFPLYITRRNKRGNAYLYTHYNHCYEGYWCYEIIYDKGLVLDLGKNKQDKFPTEEALLYYVNKGNTNRIVANLGENIEGNKIHRSYRIIY